MHFKTDPQTLDDLQIFGKPGQKTVFRLYNHTRTRGGAALLETLFREPLATADAINTRSQVIQFFRDQPFTFPADIAGLDSIEAYLSLTDPRTRLTQENRDLSQKINQLLAADGDYKLIVKGIQAIIALHHLLSSFVKEVSARIPPDAFASTLEAMENLLRAVATEDMQSGKISHERAVQLDGLFRFTVRLQLLQLLQHVYLLDMYISIAQVAQERGFNFPHALPAAANTIQAQGLYHPLLTKPVDNDVAINADKNVVFLTGANMAGKSTFMKSLGIALYTAHLGFPVAAGSMTFSVRDGIFTTINLPDDLGAGSSHFYAEVLRVKKIANVLRTHRSLFVIFDELFRGTNVKDAYDGTIAVTKAFALRKHSVFIISTHIVEAGEVLQASCDNVRFVRLPTHMNGHTPQYTYKLEPGITADRHGMVIIRNAGILELLQRSKTAIT